MQVRAPAAARILTALVFAGALVVLAATWVSVVRTLRGSQPAARVAGRTDAVVWDGRVFTSTGELARWLRGHGTTYADWKRAHPAATAVLAHTAAPEGQPASGNEVDRGQSRGQPTKQARPSQHVAAEAPVSEQARAVTRGTSAVRLLVVALAAFLGFGCLVGVAAPTLLPARIPNLAIRLLRLRQGLVATAIALFVGIAFALLQA